MDYALKALCGRPRRPCLRGWRSPSLRGRLRAKALRRRRCRRCLRCDKSPLRAGSFPACEGWTSRFQRCAAGAAVVALRAINRPARKAEAFLAANVRALRPGRPTLTPRLGPRSPAAPSLRSGKCRAAAPSLRSLGPADYPFTAFARPQSGPGLYAPEWHVGAGAPQTRPGLPCHRLPL